MGGLNATPTLNEAAPPPPLMGTITQEVALTIDKQQIQRGPFVGLVLHLHNGTNSPLMFDGNRARITVGGQCVDAVSDAALEAVAAPPYTIAGDLKVGLADAVTIGVYSALRDEIKQRGPILPRYGTDQMRREATLERFGTRILWPGDETQGIVFFRTSSKLDNTNVQLPVVTFPSMEIRGYLTGLH
jgi:hypothetical protein